MSKCAICRAPFERKYLTQKTCLDPICKQEQKRQEAIKKAERADRKARKEKLKGHQDYVSEVDEAFQLYIRLRDRDKPCICCGMPLRLEENMSIGGYYDAGHYVPRTHMATRWDEANCNAQRKYCNRRKGGNYVAYREGLIARIGEAEVLRLEAARNEIRKYTIADLKALRDHFKAKAKALKNSGENMLENNHETSKLNKSEGPAVDMPALLSTTLEG